jgi:hypothetical protein
MELETLFGRESAARKLLKNKALRIPLNQWRTLCSRSKTGSVKAGKLLPSFLCRFKYGGWLRRKRNLLGYIHLHQSSTVKKVVFLFIFLLFDGWIRIRTK